MRDLHAFTARLVVAALALGCQEATTSVRAPLDGPRFHEQDPTDPGATGPDVRSKNVKLLANVAGPESRTSTDLAFAGRYVYAGDYGGFRIIDISDPEHPTVVSDVACNGAQGDVSVYGNLLFQSVDKPQTTKDCTSVDAPSNAPTEFEGVRIFDVSNPASPRLLDFVTTPCGSHTHTLVPDPSNGRVLVYVSSYPATSSFGPPCTTADGFGYISIAEVLLAAPAAPKNVSKYFLDGDTETYSALGIQVTGCHDITVFLEIKRAAAACLSETQMWDISDPEKPKFLWRFDDPAVNKSNGDIWHSAAFSWDGKTVAFGDESGGGGDARCVDPTDQHGRIWFLNVETGALRGTYKIPRSESGKCTAHNFNFVPLPKGRRVLVSAYYTGGTTIVDVDKLLGGGAGAAAAEVGVFRPAGGRVWSSYWYNGFIYTNDMLRGVDVLLLSDDVRGGARQLPYSNPQTQESVIP